MIIVIIIVIIIITAITITITIVKCLSYALYTHDGGDIFLD